MDSLEVAGPKTDGKEIEEPKPAGAAQSKRRFRMRWLILCLIVLAAAAGAAGLVLYWQEGELREAQRELHSGDPERALALVTYFLDSHPEHGRALALKARALTAIGRAGEAIELYEKVGAASAEDVHAWARAYLMRQSWSRALPLLTQATVMQPDNAEAWYELTSCRLRLGLLLEALDSARRLSELPNQRVRGLVMVAAIQNDVGNPQESLKAYQQAIAACPDGKGLQIPPEELFLQYGTALVNHGKGQEAVHWLKQSLVTRPTPDACFYLGNAFSQAGNQDGAVEAWQKAVELDPRGFDAREALANAALQKRDVEAALKWLAPLEQLAQQRYKTAYLFLRVHTLRKDEAAVQQWKKKADELRQREQRLGVIDQLIARSPHSFWANVARAHRFASRGNWQQAEDMLNELAREAPQDKFVQELAAAVRQRGTLPPLERLPVRQF